MPRWLMIFIPFVLGVLAYANTLSYGFVYDDRFYTCRKEYQQISSIPLAFQLPYSACTPRNGIYRPIPTVTFILTTGIFGDNPMPHHVVNILLNGIIASLLFIILTKILSIDPLLSLAIASVFAVLPIHTEVVANIKSRDELFGMLFFLCMWIFYDKSKQKKYWFIVSSIFFLLALLSKENALIYPLIIGFVAYIKKQQSVKDIIFTTSLYIIPIILYFGIRYIFKIPSILSQSEFGYIYNPLIYESIVARIFSPLSIFVTYLEKTVFPLYLSASYHFSHFKPITNPLENFSWVIGIVLLVVSGVIFFIFRKKYPAIILGLMLFFIPYIFISQTFFVGGDVIAERWMYLPSLGVIMVLLGVLYYFLRSRKKYFVIIVSILICLYFGKTITRNSVWASNETLFYSMKQDAPNSVRGHILLANHYLLQEKNVDLATEELLSAYLLFSEDAELNAMLGLISLINQRYEDTRYYLTRSSIQDPYLVLADRYWAQFLFVEDDYIGAYQKIKKIIDGNIYQWNDIFIYVATLIKLKQYDNAEKWLNTLSDIEKQQSQIMYITAVLLYKTGNKEEALSIIWDASLTTEQRHAMFEEF